MRESPSGKASAFQADIRGFESHLPLYDSVPASGALVSGCLTLILEHLTLKGPVAQRLAQATHNRLVAGSNPAGPTTI